METIPSSFALPRALRWAYRTLKGPWPLLNVAKRLRPWIINSPRRVPTAGIRQRSNRAAASDLDHFQGLTGSGSGWARTEYGDYYATAVSVYAAVKLRADALSRPPLNVFRRTTEGARLTVEPSHPVQQLLDQVNPESTERRLWGQSLKKPEGAPLNLG